MGHKDITGQRFGKLVVVKKSDRKDSTRSVFWECRCDCGGTRVTRGTALRAGKVNSCGCLLEERYRNGSTKIDIIGQRFGRLVVTAETEDRTKCGEVKYLCQCDCGNTKVVAGTVLRYGKTKSCGCLLSEETSKRALTHGMSKTKIYKVWNGLIQRCHCETDTSYKYYGERGIAVCDEWRNDPEAFIAWAKENGWKPGLEIDRIDNYKGYSPDNCRIVTHKENMRNLRRHQE